MLRIPLIVSAAVLALAGGAAAEPAAAPQPHAEPLAGQAHLLYRMDPHSKPIEGRVTVLQPAAPGDARERPAEGPQVQITIVQIAQT